MTVYAAREVCFEPGPRPEPLIGGAPLPCRWRWVAEGPWYYFEAEKPLLGLDAAPANYPNGNPVGQSQEDWRDPTTQKVKAEPVTAERAVALAQKLFNARATTVKALEYWGLDTQKRAVRIDRQVTSRAGYTCKEAVLAALDKLPAGNWLWAVAEHEDGSRSAATAMERISKLDDLAAISGKLHEQNTYVAPNFNCDTSTNIAGLTALKGSAPELTDKIYMYGVGGVFPTLTVESALSILIIVLGEMSSGAAGAGQRCGKLTTNAGVTMTFKGDPTGTNSGIKSYPASADTSSKQCRWTPNGIAASHIILTNDGDAKNTAKRWFLYLFYGGLGDGGYVDFRQSYNGLLYVQPTATHTDKTDGFKLNHCTAIGCSVVSMVSIERFEYNVQLRFWTVTHDCAGYPHFVTLGTYMTATQGELDVSGFCYQTTTAAAGYTFLGLGAPRFLVNTWRYYDSVVNSASDIRPTEVVPTGLALADMGNGKGFKVTITNAGSYASTDMLRIYASDGTTVLGCGTLAEYAANSGIICGNVTLGSQYAGVTAKATSDGRVFSAASAAAAACTPAKRTVPAVGKVMADAGQFGDGGTELTPTLPLAKVHPDKGGTMDLPGITRVAADDTLETVTGQLALANILVAAGGTFDEAARNHKTAAASDILVGKNVTIAAVSTDGTLSFAVPTTPTCVTGTPTATTIPVTITADTGTTNTLFYALEDALTWTQFSTTRTGSGLLTITGLIEGRKYCYFCRSTDSGSAASVISETVQLPSTNGSTPTFTLITAASPVYTEV